MKQGKTLSQLAAEIERQQTVKRDYIAAPSAMMMVGHSSGQPELAIANGNTHHFGIREIAHGQIAQTLGIPKDYYDRMRSTHPSLLADNVNTWMAEQKDKRMVRTLDGHVRAFLSDKYQRIDNFDIANTVLPILSGTKGLRIASCEVTETKLYIKAITSELRGTVVSKRSGKVGEIVEGGVMITNSEVGLGSVSVKPYALELWCTNGAVIDRGMRAAHIGARHKIDGDIAELLTDETKRIEDRAVLLKVRDVVNAAFDAARFAQWIEKLQASTERKIEGDPSKTVEVLANDYGFNTTERVSIMRHLIEGGDLSAFGLMNAVTRTAEDVESYDRATELETVGPALIQLPANEWKRLAEVE